MDELLAGLQRGEDLFVSQYRHFGTSRALRVNVALADDGAFGKERAAEFYREYADCESEVKWWQAKGTATTKHQAQERHAQIISAAHHQLDLVASRKKSLSHVSRHVARKLGPEVGLSTVRRVLATELRKRRRLS